MTQKSKIVIWDIETTPIKNYAWSPYPTYMSHESIIEDWSIICGSWKEVGKKQVNATAIKKVGNDKEVVRTLRDAIGDADAVVHHNGDKFDIKKLNTRLIYHGLDPLPLIHTVDTKKELKKIAGFTSNKLDYVAKMLFGEGKIHVEYQLWLDVMRGDMNALKKMVNYNIGDVRVLERVYLYLRPYMKSHPHIGAAEGKSRFTSCPNCGSEDIQRNGTRFTRAGIARQKCQCSKCHAHFQVNK